MKPKPHQAFTLGPGRTQIEDAASAQAGSWWQPYATGPRDEQFAAAVTVRFPSKRSHGPLLHDWSNPA